MIRILRTAARGLAAAFILIGALGDAHAAGALAVGTCGAYGYDYISATWPMLASQRCASAPATATRSSVMLPSSV